MLHIHFLNSIMDCINNTNNNTISIHQPNLNLKAIMDIRSKLINEFYTDMKSTAERVKKK